MENKRTQWYIGAPNGVVLCINGKAEAGELSGLMYHSYSSAAVPFENVEQMTSYMERLYDWLRFPHPGTTSRSFTTARRAGNTISERKKVMSDESLLSRHGDMGSFIVRVQHRQNSSWQGRITWMEQDKTVYFRSVWEMIKLIESAVNTVSNPDDDEGEATWFVPDVGQK